MFDKHITAPIRIPTSTARTVKFGSSGRYTSRSQTASGSSSGTVFTRLARYPGFWGERDRLESLKEHDSGADVRGMGQGSPPHGDAKRKHEVGVVGCHGRPLQRAGAARRQHEG